MFQLSLRALYKAPRRRPFGLLRRRQPLLWLYPLMSFRLLVPQDRLRLTLPPSLCYRQVFLLVLVYPEGSPRLIVLCMYQHRYRPRPSSVQHGRRSAPAPDRSRALIIYNISPKMLFGRHEVQLSRTYLPPLGLAAAHPHDLTHQSHVALYDLVCVTPLRKRSWKAS